MDLMRLIVRFAADTSEVEKAIKSTQTLGQKFSGGLKTAAKAAGVAITAATTAVVAFTKKSVDVGKEFDASMSQVAATMGKTTDEIQDLRQFAQEMGRETAFSATQAAEALNYMALAGYDSETSMKMLPNVLNLAAAGGMELATASDMVTDAQSALGLSLEETSEMVDKMAKASTKSNTSVAQLGEAFLTVGGTAKDLAGGTTELSTVLGILADNGIKGSEGGTALRNIILALEAPTDKAAKAMKALGLEVFDANGNMRPMEEIFGDLNDRLATMNQGERTQVLNEIFNKVDLKSVNALLATNVDRWDELTTAIDDSTGAAKAMADVQLDNLEGDITLFKSALEGAQITISDVLTPTLRQFVQFGTGAVGELTKAFEEDGLNGAMDALGHIISDGIALIMEGLPGFVDAGMQLVKSIVTGLIEQLPAIVEAGLKIIVSLIQGIAEALPKLIPAIQDVVVKIAVTLTEPSTLVSLAEAAVAIIIALAKGLVAAVPKLLQAIPQIIANVVQALILGAEKLVKVGAKWVGSIISGITEKAKDLVQGAKDLALNVRDSIKNNWENVKTLGSNLVAKIKNGIAAKKKDILTSASDLAKNVAESFSSKWEKAKTIGGNLIAYLAKGVSQKASKLNENISKIVGAIGDYWSSFVEACKTYGSGIIVNLGNGIGSKVQDLYDAYKNIVQNIVDSVKNVIEAAKNWGSGLLVSFINGIIAKFNTLREKLGQVGKIIKDFLHFSQPDKGPLSGPNGFESYAPDMMRSFGKGITDNADYVTKAINRSFDFGDQIKGFANGTVMRSIDQGDVIPRGAAQTVGGSVRNMTTILQLDRYTLGRVVYELYNEEQQRVGVKLAGGTV